MKRFLRTPLPKTALWKGLSQFCSPSNMSHMRHEIGRYTYVLLLIAIFVVIGVASPSHIEQEAPDQPISHIYRVLAGDIQSFANSLNPIGIADAALPNFTATDRVTDPDSNDGITGEANNFGEQSLADDTPSKNITIKLAKGETLVKGLISAGVSATHAKAANDAMAKIYSPKNINQGEEVTIDFAPATDANGKDKGRSIESISFAPTHDRRVVVSRDSNNKFRAKFESRPVEVRSNLISITITNSLSGAAKKAGMPRGILSEVTRVLSYDLDFQRDIHPGDKLEVLFEEVYDENGNLAKYGNLLYAGLRYGKKDIKVYRYQPSDDSKADYFDAEGRPVRKALLRTPVDGAKITSGFGVRRHPILGYSKMHEGVDFGAPMGTPVIAAGDGVVTKREWNGGYGHYVEIRHNKEFATAYGHLSRYNKNLRLGQRIHQGEVIGYVGSTGMSTGPHLHYEVHRFERKINPMGVKFSTGRTLAGKELARFKLAMNDTQSKLAKAKGKPAHLASR